jgi:hypothetical protein
VSKLQLTLIGLQKRGLNNERLTVFIILVPNNINISIYIKGDSVKNVVLFTII